MPNCLAGIYHMFIWNKGYISKGSLNHVTTISHVLFNLSSLNPIKTKNKFLFYNPNAKWEAEDSSS